jgi:hypothetical protein
MRRALAFVLVGGGARGVLQVGALRALLEAGFQPDLVVGTSAGAISNLPIEPAILQGATEIIALDLSAPDEIDPEAHGFGPFWVKFLNTIIGRQAYLEMELARAKGIPVHRVELTAEPPVPIWDFGQAQALLKAGYRQMKAALELGEVSSFSQIDSDLGRWMKWASIQKHEIQPRKRKDLVKRQWIRR